MVDLTVTSAMTKRGASREAFSIAPYEIPRGCTATYSLEADVLVPINSVAERSGKRRRASLW